MKRPQITAVNHYDIFPFNHGGSLGIRGLYKALSEWFDVNIITFVNYDIYPDEVAISNHVKVIPIVKPRELITLEEEMYKKYNMNSGTLVDSSPSVIRYYHKFPEIIDRVREISGDSLIVIAEHTFTFKIIETACPSKHIWYRANNVEYDYKRTTWDKIDCPQDLLMETFDLEKECCEKCEIILTVSDLESKRFTELYNLPPEKLFSISSGFDTDKLQTVLPSQRIKYFEKYAKSGLFIASNTPVAVSAALEVIEIAREMSDVQFIIMGSVSKGIRNADVPVNVEITGIVSDDVKFNFLKTCDFALNLIEGGAGINVKMFEYFAYGLPVITTEHGARGIDLTDRKDCFITSCGRYISDITEFLSLTLLRRDKVALSALVLLLDKYSWRSIGAMIAERIGRMYSFPASESQVNDIDKIALYTFENTKSYIPSKPVYVRGAGEWGQKCVEYLLSNGVIPEGIIDEDVRKHGNEIKGVKVVNAEDFLLAKKDCEVIIAINTFIPLAAQLALSGVGIKDMAVALYGVQILSLADGQGDCPYYYIAPKIREAILNEVDFLENTYE